MISQATGNLTRIITGRRMNTASMVSTVNKAVKDFFGIDTDAPLVVHNRRKTDKPMEQYALPGEAPLQ